MFLVPDRAWGLSTTACTMIGGKRCRRRESARCKMSLEDLTAFACKADEQLGGEVSSEAGTSAESADVLCIARTHCLPSCL